MTARERTFSRIAKRTGLSIKTIQSMSPSKLRLHLEQKNKKKFSFSSEFPTIGRGNILRDRLETTEQLNKEVDLILDSK